MLIAAFTRSIRDPFVHARAAGLLALSATIDFFTEEDCAAKVLPAICPVLLDRERYGETLASWWSFLTMHRLIREQANKTLDLYIQRIRKYGGTMPDTVQPPANVPDATKEATRMGTSNDKSWAGWAISSFTNKITTAEGEIQPTANGSKPAEAPAARPASVPRPAKSPPSLHPPKETLRPKPPPLGRSVSEQPAPVAKEEEDEADDVIEAWDAVDEDNGWDQPNEEDPFSVSSPSASAASKPSPVPFDDGGEPDFAGWLAAQSTAKAKKPLPKGLNRTGSSAASRTATAKPKASAAPAKKIDTKPREEEEDDDWGAAW